MDKKKLDKIADKLEQMQISTERLKSYNEYFYSDIENIGNTKIMDRFYALSYAIGTSIKDIKNDLSDAYSLSINNDK